MDNYIVRKNGTLLLSPGKIPKSKHMLFNSLEDEYIEEFLVSEYSNEFPKEYINFLKYSNGANLFNVKIKNQKFEYAYAMFIIFGLPLTSPFERSLDMEEPFDVRVEDLARHEKISDKWLKCGTYIKDCDFRFNNDIFIDTETHRVFSCRKNDFEIVDSWNSLDECFCNIYNSLIECGVEYKKDAEGHYFCVK